MGTELGGWIKKQAGTAGIKPSLAEVRCLTILVEA
jgi:hypothetical protein